MKHAVILICDGMRADMVRPQWTPNLCRLSGRGRRFNNHRSVVPSTTRVASASIATGCLPGRHGLEGNTFAIEEEGGLVAVNAGGPDFRDRLERATGRTLKVPTLAERVKDSGGFVMYSNVSHGATMFQDPDGHGHIHHRDFACGPGRAASAPLGISYDAAGDTEMTERFLDQVLGDSRPAVSLIWICEPDHTQHAAPLGSPANLDTLAAADANAGRLADALAAEPETLVLIGSDHGHETISQIVDLTGPLVAAGLKSATESDDVVLASNAVSVLVYVAETARDRIPAIVATLEGIDGVGDVFSGPRLRDVGHGDNPSLVAVVTARFRDAENDFGIPGLTTAFTSPFSSDLVVGCAQHGGLGVHEQAPFLLALGGGFRPGTSCEDPTSILDLAPTVLRHLGLPEDGMDGAALPAG